MKSDRVIESAIRAAQNLLWQNLPPTHKLPDAAAVARLRDLVRSPAVKTVLLHSKDTFLAFVLPAVEFVLADQFRADREIIDHLWDVLDDPHLNKALGLPQNSRMTFPQVPLLISGDQVWRRRIRGFAKRRLQLNRLDNRGIRPDAPQPIPQSDAFGC